MAARNKVPVLILRGVSDLVGEQGGEAYGNIAMFEAGATRVMVSLLKHLPGWLERVRFEVFPPDPSLPVDIPLSVLGLSMRTYNALRRSGYITVGEVIQSTEEEIASIRNIGAKSIAELKEALARYGLRLRDDVVDEGISEESVWQNLGTAYRRLRLHMLAPALMHYQAPISVLPLPRRLKQTFQKHGWLSVGDLAKQTVDALARFLKSAEDRQIVHEALVRYWERKTVSAKTSQQWVDHVSVPPLLHDDVDTLLHDWLSGLPPRSREILALRYGRDGPPATLQSIGNRYGITRERVRQIAIKALEHLNDPPARIRLRHLDEYLFSLFKDRPHGMQEQEVVERLREIFPDANDTLLQWLARLWLAATPEVQKGWQPR